MRCPKGHDAVIGVLLLYNNSTVQPLHYQFGRQAPESRIWPHPVSGILSQLTKGLSYVSRPVSDSRHTSIFTDRANVCMVLRKHDEQCHVPLKSALGQ